MIIKAHPFTLERWTRPSTINPEIWNLNPEPWTLNPEPWTLNPEPWTRNLEPWSIKSARIHAREMNAAIKEAEKAIDADDLEVPNPTSLQLLLDYTITFRLCIFTTTNRFYNFFQIVQLLVRCV